LTLVILPIDEVNGLDGIARAADRQANPNRWNMVMERAEFIGLDLTRPQSRQFFSISRMAGRKACG
jgi:hypothetical protein